MAELPKINIEVHKIGPEERKIKLDDHGRMAVRLDDGTIIKGTPQELFGQRDELTVVGMSPALDEELRKAIEEEIRNG